MSKPAVVWDGATVKKQVAEALAQGVAATMRSVGAEPMLELAELPQPSGISYMKMLEDIHGAHSTNPNDSHSARNLNSKRLG